MSLPDISGNGKSHETALRNAHALTRMGVPVFAGRLDANGDPDHFDKRWKRWQDKQPSHRAVDAWKPGEALCAVTGVVFDVLDWDPRNDPEERSWNRLVEALGDEGPFKFWEVRTPRGGSHIWVARMDIGKHTGFLPGLDLQGGMPDGSGRGFVFLPPTSRNGGVYRPTSLLKPYGDNSSIGGLREFVLGCLDSGAGLDGSSSNGTRRSGLAALRAGVLAAEAGEQRGALLKLVHEYERMGTPREVIKDALRAFLAEVPVFDSRRPWLPSRNPDKWINGLFHRSGKVIADAEPGELEGIDEPRRSGLVRSFAEVGRRRTSWLWRGYVARGEMTMLDGEKGVSKSLIIEDIAARFTTGRILPGVKTATGEVHRTIIFTAESSAEKEVGPRLDAAGADVSRVFCTQVPKAARGKKAAPEWILPDGASRFAAAIHESGATIAIFDPINDFLAEDINTNNDASIRRALMPLGLALANADCGGILIRHMNKNTGTDARYRGAGTTAYQNRARIHLVAARIPDDLRPESGAMYGLAIVDNNLMRVDRGMVLAYDVVDSEIPASDEDDDYIPMIEWHGPCAINVNDMVNGNVPKRQVSMEFEMIREVLADMFAKSDTWPANRCWQELRDAGYSAKYKGTVSKVQKALGITPVRRMAKTGTGGVKSWDWTTKTPRGSVRSLGLDDEE